MCAGYAVCRNRRGAAYVLALVTVLAGATLALALLRAGIGSFVSERSQDHRQAAVNLAEAGIDYAYWRVHYGGQRLPYSAAVELSTGTFKVSATDDGSREPSTMLITSTGTAYGHSYTVQRVALGLLPYCYNCCENREISTGKQVWSGGTWGGFRANGKIKLDSEYSVVTDGGWATTNFEGKGSISPQYPNSPPIGFPEIDYSYYDSIATDVWHGDQTVLALNSMSPAVVRVHGKVELMGLHYLGRITIVADDDIIINGFLRKFTSDSYLALITQKKIKIQNYADHVDAIMYCHKADGSADLEIHRNTTICGVAASDDCHIDDPTCFEDDPGITTQILTQLHMPGL